MISKACEREGRFTVQVGSRSEWPSPASTRPASRATACAPASPPAPCKRASRPRRSGLKPAALRTRCFRATSGTGSSSLETPLAFFFSGGMGSANRGQKGGGLRRQRAHPLRRGSRSTGGEELRLWAGRTLAPDFCIFCTKKTATIVDSYNSWPQPASFAGVARRGRGCAALHPRVQHGLPRSPGRGSSGNEALR